LSKIIKPMTRRTRFALLILISLLLTVSVYAVITARTPILMKNKIDKELDQKQYQTALDLSIKLMQLYPSAKQARESAYIIINHYLDNSIKDITIGAGFSYSHGGFDEGFVIKEEDRGNLFKLMALVAEEQRNSMWTQHLYRELGETAVGFKKYALAEDFYQLAFDGYQAGGHDYWTNEMAIIQMRYFRNRGDFDTAHIYLDYLLEHADDGLMLEAEVHAWNGTFLVEAEQYEEGAKEFLLAKELVNKSLRKDSGVDEGAVAYSEYQPAYIMAEHGLSYIELIRETKGKDTVESGVVVTLTRNGQPVQGIRGQLLEEPEDVYSSMSSSEYNTITLNSEVSDSAGQLVFTLLPVGKYDLVFHFDRQDLLGVGAFKIPDTINVEAGSLQNYQIELRDRVTITSPIGLTKLAYGETLLVTWDEYPGAESYRIDYVYYTDRDSELGSSSIGSTLGQTTDTSFTVDTDSMKDRKPIGFYSDSDVYPVSILGLYHPESRSTIKVFALDHDGNTLSDSYGLLYDKNSNYPLWIIGYPEDKTLLVPGDRLLLEGKYDEAIEAYLDEAANGNPLAQSKANHLKTALLNLEGSH